jgi:UDP-glucose:(heptosyl)LPS alpha-1,3-glucosyltransferase
VRITVISPFVDRRHGTERAVAELVERLAARYGDRIELYAQRIADLTNVAPDEYFEAQPGAICWHRVGKFPGPHILQFLSWLFLNRRARERNQRKSGQRADIVFSPGINALDVDLVLVHAVFHRLAELQTGSGGSGLRGLHRRLYYALLCRLERRIYTNPRVTLAAVSKHTAEQLAHYFGRRDVTVIPNGVDEKHFSAGAVARLRAASRQRWHCAPEQTVLLLIGNDWRNKGLPALLAAMARCSDLKLRLLVAGQDHQAAFRARAAKLGLRERVEFCPSEDARSFYAAADVLVAPSLEDSFNLPVLEAMACGLPCIVSTKAGLSEWLTHGFNALLLRDPEDAGEIAEAIRVVAGSAQLRKTLAENASATAKKFSWDEHALQLRTLMEATAKKKLANTKTANAK